MIETLTKEMIQAEGLREGFFHIEEETYYAIDAISQSALKEYRKTPANYLAYSNRSPEPTKPVFIEGKAWHMALLEPERFLRDAVVEPEFNRRTKAGKEEYEEWRDRNGGKLIIDRDVYDRVCAGVRQIREDENMRPYVTGGFPEVVGLKKLSDDLWAKVRLDYWIPERRLIIDPKTTFSASRKDFGYSITKFDYLIQAAFYVDIVEQLIGASVNGFGFLAMEKDPPYAYRLYFPTERAIARGREMYQHCLNKHRKCLKDNHWPLYVDLIEIWEPDDWFFRQSLE